MSRWPRSVVAVSGDTQRAELLDALQLDGNDYGVVFVESFAGGYSRIKQLTPDLVLVFLEIDDVAACRLLSMLKIDCQTSGIPVVTWTARPEPSRDEDIFAEVTRDLSCQISAARMN